MKKIIFYILILALIILIPSIIIYSINNPKNVSPEFFLIPDGIEIGMYIDDYKKEMSEDFEEIENEDFIYHIGKLRKNKNIEIRTNNSSSTVGQIDYTMKHDKTNSDIFDYFDKLKLCFSEKYGEKYQVEELWIDETYKNQPDMIYEAIKLGHCIRSFSWNNKDNDVIIYINGEYIVVSYLPPTNN